MPQLAQCLSLPPLGFLILIGSFVLVSSPVGMLSPAMVDRVLTREEMKQTHGDGGSNPCYQNRKCSDNINLGASQCMYCADFSTVYPSCCNLGTNTHCVLDAGTALCGNVSRWVADIVGTADSCGTCNGGTFNQSGTCPSRNGVDTANSDKCP